MKTALDTNLDLLDEDEKIVVENVRTHGWFGNHVLEDADGPSFSYTTGFWQRFGFPELILFALPHEASHEIFWNFFNDLESGKRFDENEPISEVLNGYDVVMKRVRPEHHDQYLGWNRWFYRGDNFEAYQIFFPDRSGRFPWAEDVSPEFSQLQPSLTDPLN